MSEARRNRNPFDPLPVSGNSYVAEVEHAAYVRHHEIKRAVHAAIWECEEAEQEARALIAKAELRADPVLRTLTPKELVELIALGLLTLIVVIWTTPCFSAAAVGRPGEAAPSSDRSTATADRDDEREGA